MIIKLCYISHNILNSKYKALIYIILYLIISALITNNANIIECMNQDNNENNIPPIIPRTENTTENIYYLVLENSQLRERVETLEHLLQNNLKQRSSEKVQFDSTMRFMFEENQRLREQLHDSYQTITENNRILNRLVQENTLLRVTIEQNHSDTATDLDIESERP